MPSIQKLYSKSLNPQSRERLLGLKDGLFITHLIQGRLGSMYSWI